VSLDFPLTDALHGVPTGEVAHPIPDPGAETRLAEARSSRLASSSWPPIAFVAALGLCLAAFHIVSELQPDSYMTLDAGRWIAQHGIPHSEVFTIAAHGRRWIDQQWLAELIDYEAWRIAGYAGLALLNASLIGFAYASVAALIRRRGGSVVLVIGCSVIALAAGLASLFIRAQDLALPLFVLLVALCLTDAERHLPGRRLLLLLPLLVLWANLHGSVLLGADWRSRIWRSERGRWLAGASGVRGRHVSRSRCLSP
jgi:hypothetical protein